MIRAVSRSSAIPRAFASTAATCSRPRRHRISTSKHGRQSVDRILAWSPATLMLTHFGPVTDVRPHFASLLDNLQTTSGIALALLNGPGTDEERSSAFAEKLRHQIRTQMTESEVATYVVAAAYEHLFSGLARYWRKKGAAT